MESNPLVTVGTEMVSVSFAVLTVGMLLAQFKQRKIEKRRQEAEKKKDTPLVWKLNRALDRIDDRRIRLLSALSVIVVLGLIAKVIGYLLGAPSKC